MFFYFYDTFVLDKQNEGTLTRVENRIIELGINGRVEKLTPLRNMKELLEDGVKQEAHTIVIIGDDATFVRAVNIVANHNVVLGYIPFGKESALAQIFGITDTFEACNILSRRVVKAVNLAKANSNYFLTSLVAKNSEGLNISCDNEFTVSSRTHPTQFSVHNLGDIFSDLENSNVYINTNHLHLQIEPQAKGRSLFGKKSVSPNAGSVLPIKKAYLDHTDSPIPVVLDNETTLKTPITVTIKPKQQKIIVGKERLV